ncbi:MAG: hypothetical protein EOP48_31705 [Sphingobacteriales bacterium]|nr:MAG: hypothetical protein EOP48_31705 [Sphingobacteriales bacterium]
MNRVKYLFIPIFLIVFCGPVCAQTSALPVRDTLSREFMNQYHALLGQNAGIYSGPKRPTYKEELQGSPYFGEANTFNTGWVIYDNVKYENVPLKLDEYAGELITIYHTNKAELSLRTDLVRAFSFSGLNFIHITKADSISSQIPTGFYEQIYNGTHQALVKNIKSLKDFGEIKNKAQYFDGKLHFYVKKNRVYHQITDARGLERLFKENRSALKKYMRANGINFKKDPKRAVQMVAAWSDNLN